MKKYILPLILILLTYILTGYCATYTSQYPTHDTDHVKATTAFTGANPYHATDPAKSVIGDGSESSWLSDPATTITNQRFHIDLESGKIIKRIYYENFHATATNTDRGVQNFTFWGSNIGAGSFDDLVWGNDGGWTELTVATNVMLEHVALDQADPQYIVVTNSTSYRYYAFKFADNWGDPGRIGVRRLELQTEDAVGITWNGITIKKWNGVTITTPINTQ